MKASRGLVSAPHRVIVQAQHGIALPVNLPEARVRQLKHLRAHVTHLTEKSEHVVRLAELVALSYQETHLPLKVHERLEARDSLQKLKLREGEQEAIITTGAWDASGKPQRRPVATGSQATRTAHHAGHRGEWPQALNSGGNSVAFSVPAAATHAAR